MAEHRNPKPTVDVVILLPDDRVVLVERRNAPHGWALPGGFVDEGETLEAAATLILLPEFYNAGGRNISKGRFTRFLKFIDFNSFIRILR